MSFLDKSKFKQCDCGTQVDEEHFEAKPHFSSIGWFFITIMGTTMNPTEIVFHCKRCKKDFDVLRDKELIKYFEQYKKR